MFKYFCQTEGVKCFNYKLVHLQISLLVVILFYRTKHKYKHLPRKTVYLDPYFYRERYRIKTRQHARNTDSVRVHSQRQTQVLNENKTFRFLYVFRTYFIRISYVFRSYFVRISYVFSTYFVRSSNAHFPVTFNINKDDSC